MSSKRPPLKTRLLHVTLEVFAPGAGYFALGHRMRAIGWLAATVGAAGCAVGATIWGSLSGFWLASVTLISVRVVSILGCIRAPEAARPKPLILLGVFAVTATSLTLLGTAIREDVAEAFRIPSDAMYPNLVEGDRIMVNKLSRQPERGAVVVFFVSGHPDTLLVKRIVALPGETIHFRNEQVILNAQPLSYEAVDMPCRARMYCELVEESSKEASYRISVLKSVARTQSTEILVPADHVFVLGDNRDGDVDSRVFGPVPIENIVGRVQFTWLSTGGS